MVDGKAKCDYPKRRDHRRQKAGELACFTDMPCIIHKLTDEQVIIQMVEDNYLHIAEFSEEQNENMLDGVLNNLLPSPLPKWSDKKKLDRVKESLAHKRSREWEDL